VKKIIRITTSSGSLRSLLKGQLRFMNQHYEIIGVATSGIGIDQVREREGIQTIAIDMTRHISPIQDLIATYKLYKLIKKEEPFAVHTHTPKAGTLGMLASRLAGVKHRLHTIAGMPLLVEKGIKRKILNVVEKFTYKNATVVLPNSNGLYNIIIEKKLAKPEKLKVIGNGSSNGINTTHFNSINISDEDKRNLRGSLNYSDDDIIFIFIGRLVKDKGTNELIQAFCELNGANNKCKLLLVGLYEQHMDPLNKNTSDLIESNDAINFVGRQADVRPYLAISNVLTFPSYREGFPNVVLEAGAMGLPSIVTNINGCNEIIEDQFNGLIIPVRDVESLLTAMKFMINNPDKRKRMASNARTKIVSNYEQDYVWNEILKLYNSLN
jgi:glycosyltransferase involved in cell wall biosynthesis